MKMNIKTFKVKLQRHKSIKSIKVNVHDCDIDSKHNVSRNTYFTILNKKPATEFVAQYTIYGFLITADNSKQTHVTGKMGI